MAHAHCALALITVHLSGPGPLRCQGPSCWDGIGTFEKSLGQCYALSWSLLRASLYLEHAEWLT
eukprot:6192542-Pleurochrysis_carterae.AAC.1